MWFSTPEEAALDGMPSRFTHVVVSQANDEGTLAWVLLAVEASGIGYYLDENLCERGAGGTWRGRASCGGGWTDRTLDDLRTSPPDASFTGFR